MSECQSRQEKNKNKQIMLDACEKIIIFNQCTERTISMFKEQVLRNDTTDLHSFLKILLRCLRMWCAYCDKFLVNLSDACETTTYKSVIKYIEVYKNDICEKQIEQPEVKKEKLSVTEVEARNANCKRVFLDLISVNGQETVRNDARIKGNYYSFLPKQFC